MADLLLTQGADFLATEGGNLLALQSATSTTSGTVTLVQNLPRNHYYDIGDVPVFTATFLDLAGALTDPEEVEFLFVLPNGSPSTWVFGTDDEVDTTGTGVYVFVAPELTVRGVHWCRVESTEITAAAERAIGVRETKFN